ncbi:hypothetical protein [Mucilaginibacter sp.]|uniref:hypothetical protein n=1 Tax=Mucilaginibacter sp. TaxID=1882438 RepID=UPI00260C2446|nr:hypothetical protein [Mucilaginibacter sp.]MDB4919858.1 hypothetical protein [Mucilaginibacter sp.]
MTKIALDISDDVHIGLLTIQLERKKKKVEPTAINKIAAELLEKMFKEESKKPAK